MSNVEVKSPPTTTVASGRWTSLPVPVEFRGSGQAYASGVKADDLHSLMRIAGYGAVVDATASAEKWTFTPEGWDSAVPPTFASGVGELYGRGEMIPLSGTGAGFIREVTITAHWRRQLGKILFPLLKAR